MTLTVDVSVSEALTAQQPECADRDVPEPALLQRWAQAAYQHDEPAVVSLLVTSAEQIQQLNKQYRGRDEATNVLSFPMQSPPGTDLCLLGDIVLCASVIRQQAAAQSKSEKSHWALMVVHGMLHLQGYDHLDDDEAEVMERLETDILRQLGFDNPYQENP